MTFMFFLRHKGSMDTHTYFLECVWHKGYWPEQYLWKELGTQHLTHILTNSCAWRFPGLPTSPSKSWVAYSRLWLWWYHCSHLPGKTLPGWQLSVFLFPYLICKKQILPFTQMYNHLILVTHLHLFFPSIHVDQLHWSAFDMSYKGVTGMSDL